MSDLDPCSLLIPSQDGSSTHLNLLAKRTYTFTPGRPCEVASAQPPIVLKPEYHPKGPNAYPAPRMDPDVFCALKSGTDFVVQGSAYSLAGPVESMEVRVGLRSVASQPEQVLRQLRVFGDRKAEYRGVGILPRFLPATPFVEMPITYDRAYGGKDIWAEQHHPDEVMDWYQKYSNTPRNLLSSYVYARNPAGKGYLVYDHQEAIEGVDLPNIEDPDDLLSPERLCLGHPDAWPRAPVPAGFDWYEQSWFPRIALLGICRPYQGSPSDFYEVRAGLLSEENVRTATKGFSLPTRDHRFFQGASPRLVLPTLSGTETFVFVGMHPQLQRLEVPLPQERPRMLVELPGTHPTELSPRLRSVVVQPDKHCLSLVWAGRFELSWPIRATGGKHLRHAVHWI